MQSIFVDRQLTTYLEYYEFYHLRQYASFFHPFHFSKLENIQLGNLYTYYQKGLVPECFPKQMVFAIPAKLNHIVNVSD